MQCGRRREPHLFDKVDRQRFGRQRTESAERVFDDRVDAPADEPRTNPGVARTAAIRSAAWRRRRSASNAGTATKPAKNSTGVETSVGGPSAWTVACVSPEKATNTAA